MMNNKQATFINGLPLPQYLIELIESGRWQAPKDRLKTDRIFPVHGQLTLYSLDYMPFENKHWLNETKLIFIGAPDTKLKPGDIDPRMSILIGDLGIGYDQPIALDYRQSLSTPRVLTLQWSRDGQSNRWIEIAKDIQEFSEMLDL